MRWQRTKTLPGKFFWCVLTNGTLLPALMLLSVLCFFMGVWLLNRMHLRPELKV